MKIQEKRILYRTRVTQGFEDEDLASRQKDVGLRYQRKLSCRSRRRNKELRVDEVGEEDPGGKIVS